MPLTKNIHFRSHDAVLVLNKYRKEANIIDDVDHAVDMLHTTVTDKVTKEVLLDSDAEYPRVLILKTNSSDFWDLVREEILSIGTGKQDQYMKCLLLQKIQKELEP